MTKIHVHHGAVSSEDSVPSSLQDIFFMTSTTYPNNKLRTAYEEIDNQRLNSRINTNYGGGATYGDCTGSWDDYSFRTESNFDTITV